ncbi:hypothetical protein BC830DRAFT_713986 [Chytriomyces sp. MP71]|nr:hypothetical protein BC830DRAFT_713986 [Chytriomyces sp. MP71]
MSGINSTSTSFPDGFDWARNLFLFDSIALASLFALLTVGFIPVFGWCAYKTVFRNVRFIYLLEVGWAVTRVVGFVLRAVTLSGSNGSNIGLAITAQVLSGIGFLPLVRIVVFEALAGLKALFPAFPFARFDRLQSLIFMAFSGMLIYYIVAYSSNLPAPATSTQLLLRDIATWGLLAFAAIPTLFAVFIAFTTSARLGGVMALTGVCLSIKMAYSLYKNYNPPPVFTPTEGYFYGLTIAPEIILALLYVTPSILEEFDDLSASMVEGKNENADMPDDVEAESGLRNAANGGTYRTSA